ncbi:hypothetical protein BMS3Abin07_01641 [bacterium BMS3Abin07]|nr:hypothetical protein BMS3Abin07_01641 [bacterium BMS3Abin07]GBE33277.1 hypothetical protein BMS3Bbin05_02216 [bacterium BMS3Bbin05]HDL19813.1 hypothetical protein [Nitrospirota bacterium]HDO22575.1 hypothetical protein [Nitrospirota bacterium]HDZ87449.1 hypothetical protein [Nitrospirota bacterium]
MKKVRARYLNDISVFIISLIILFPSITFSSGWESEFEAICSKLTMADSMSIEEIQSLIDRSDKLLKVIEASDNPGKKIFIRRLKKCRAFFEFSIEVKKEKSR